MMKENLQIKNLVVADDDFDDASLLSTSLKRIIPEAIIFTVQNGIKLTLLLNKVQPDLIFLDINMPIKNGIDILKDLSEDTKNINTRIVMYSTSLNKRDIDQSYSYGATFYLLKPLTVEALHMSLLKLLSNENFTNITLPRIEEFVMG